MTKDLVASISAAYSTYRLNNTVTNNFTPALLTPYLNYVSLDTSSVIDHALAYRLAAF
jgi:hypothetical protein